MSCEGGYVSIMLHLPPPPHPVRDHSARRADRQTARAPPCIPYELRYDHDHDHDYNYHHDHDIDHDYDSLPHLALAAGLSIIGGDRGETTRVGFREIGSEAIWVGFLDEV